ncbi:MAG: lipid-A-disaccharide synthase, partial [Paraglaciecola chathamensis]
EAMLCKRPMVVAYRMSWLTHQMMKRLYIAKYFALPNILADEELVPELLQEDVNPQNIAKKLLHYFTQSDEDKTALVGRFTQLHEVLKQDADAQAAKAVLALIEPNQESN